MHPQPYIGITGFMSLYEVETALSWFVGEGRQFEVGVLVSDQTLRGELSSRPNRYPPPDQIKTIFPRSAKTTNLIHFHTSDGTHLAEHLRRLREIGGENLDGFQLNTTWPDPREIYRFRCDYPEFLIIRDITNQDLVDRISDEALEAAWEATEPIQPTANFNARMKGILEDPNKFRDRINRQLEERGKKE